MPIPTQPQFASPARARRLATWLLPALGALIALAVIDVYAPAARCHFVMFDDDINIYQNPHLGALNAAHLKWMFFDSSYMHRFMPLGWLSLFLLFNTNGLNPAAYHVANIGLHALNAVLVFLLIRRVLELARRRLGDPGAPVFDLCAAAGSALLWALHPLRVELVGWASGILYLHCAAWGLLSALLILHRHDSPRPRLWLGLGTLAYAACVLVYPIALGLPVALLALECWLGRGRDRVDPPRWHDTAPWRSGLELAPLFVLAAFCLVAAIRAQVDVTSYWARPPSVGQFTVAQRIAQAAYACLYYLWRPWSPAPLSPVYEHLREVAPLAPRFALSIAGVVLALGLMAARWRRRPGLAAWTVAYLGVTIPYCGLLERPFQASDRYTYVSGILIACGLALLVGRIRRRALALAGASALAVAAALAAVRVPGQLAIWRDSRRLYAHIVSHLRHHEVAAVYLARAGIYEARMGRFALGEKMLAAAAARSGDASFIGFYRDMLAGLEAHGREAAQAAGQRGWIAPEAVDAEALALWGVSQGDGIAARAQFARALRLAPDFNVARYNEALFLAGEGRITTALADYLRLEASPGTALSPPSERRLLTVLGQACRLLGRRREARALAARLRRLEPVEKGFRSGAKSARLAPAKGTP